MLGRHRDEVWLPRRARSSSGRPGYALEHLLEQGWVGLSDEALGGRGAVGPRDRNIVQGGQGLLLARAESILTTAPDERSRARVIAEAFEGLEDRYPHLPDLATQAHVRETELRLQKEIEQVRADLTLKIDQLRGDMLREGTDFDVDRAFA